MQGVSLKKLFSVLFPDFKRQEGPPVLPAAGSVRDPKGVVHEFIGDHTACGVQWAAYSPTHHISIKVIGWDPISEIVTCMACIGDAYDFALRYEDPDV